MNLNFQTIQKRMQGSRRELAEQGFTLVEVLISMAIFSVGILGLITSIGTVIDYQKDADDMTQATLYTKEQIETIKSVAANENALAGGTYGFNYFVSQYPTDQTYTADSNTQWSKVETNGKFTRTTVLSIPATQPGDFTAANQYLIRFVRVDVSTAWTGARGMPKTVNLSVVMNRREIIQQ